MSTGVSKPARSRYIALASSLRLGEKAVAVTIDGNAYEQQILEEDLTARGAIRLNMAPPPVTRIDTGS